MYRRRCARRRRRRGSRRLVRRSALAARSDSPAARRTPGHRAGTRPVTSRSPPPQPLQHIHARAHATTAERHVQPVDADPLPFPHLFLPPILSLPVFLHPFFYLFLPYTLPLESNYGVYVCALQCLQSFDAVGWATGRASGL